MSPENMFCTASVAQQPIYCLRAKWSDTLWLQTQGGIPAPPLLPAEFLEGAA